MAMYRKYAAILRFAPTVEKYLYTLSSEAWWHLFICGDRSRNGELLRSKSVSYNARIINHQATATCLSRRVESVASPLYFTIEYLTPQMSSFDMRVVIENGARH